MKEFIRDNVVFVGKGSKFDSLNQYCTLVEFYPTRENVEGRCTQILLDKGEAETLHSYLSAWLQEQV